MSRSTDLAIRHGSTGACQRWLTGKPDLRLNGRKPCFSKRLYSERNLIERFFSRLKHFRRVATRYDKLADNVLAMIQLASMRLWLRAYEPTT
jgi:transposase